MVTRVNTQVPDEMLSFIENRVKNGLFDNKSEYIRHLIRQDEDAAKKKEIVLLNKMIQEGIDSGISSQSPDKIFSDLKKRIAKTHKSRK